MPDKAERHGDCLSALALACVVWTAGLLFMDQFRHPLEMEGSAEGEPPAGAAACPLVIARTLRQLVAESALHRGLPTAVWLAFLSHLVSRERLPGHVIVDVSAADEIAAEL